MHIFIWSHISVVATVSEWEGRGGLHAASGICANSWSWVEDVGGGGGAAATCTELLNHNWNSS